MYGKRKRQGDYNPRIRPALARQGPIMVGGGFIRNRAPVAMRTVRKRQYVPRTPGGQIVADNHYFDASRTSTTIAYNDADWTGSEYDPNVTAQLSLFSPVIGDDIANRTGRKVFVKNIRITGQLNRAASTAGTTGDTPVEVRLVLYQDKQTNATQSQGEDVISSGAANGAINMFQNINNFGRFRILKDKRYILANNRAMAGLTTAFVSNGDRVPFKMNLKINQWVNYNAANGGTIADVIDNSFHLIAMKSDSVTSCQIQYRARTVFAP